ncbi:hypothetical protein V8F33_006507 [Rhypophila sp. PSN 637]
MQLPTFITSLVLTAAVVLAADECQPVTWGKRDAASGEIVCRYWVTTPATVNYYTCTELCDKYFQTVDTFFTLNSQLKTDCSNIAPKTNYCMKGFVQPVISTDGFCGPQHKNASCLGTDYGQCCNSQTWRCGNSTADCAPGTCYTGVCHGGDEYSLDGLCGKQHKNLLCAGKWGECCNNAGVCGNGSSFCGVGKCQSGNCIGATTTSSSFPTGPVNPSLPPWLTGPTTTTTRATSTAKTSTTTSKSGTATTKLVAVVSKSG